MSGSVASPTPTRRGRFLGLEPWELAVLVALAVVGSLPLLALMWGPANAPSIGIVS